jgi:hypothetical protein
VRDREVSREALEALRQDFRERFGREPGPDDPVFFDPSAEKPQLLDEDGEALFTPMSEMAMRRAGIDPSMLSRHSIGQRQRLPSGANAHSLRVPEGHTNHRSSP